LPRLRPGLRARVGVLGERRGDLALVGRAHGVRLGDGGRDVALVRAALRTGLLYLALERVRQGRVGAASALRDGGRLARASRRALRARVYTRGGPSAAP
jgi:hypothetical protein